MLASVGATLSPPAPAAQRTCPAAAWGSHGLTSALSWQRVRRGGCKERCSVSQKGKKGHSVLKHSQPSDIIAGEHISLSADTGLPWQLEDH